MNINALIVDDSKDKINILRNQLILLGLLEVNIYSAENAAEAREVLNLRSYDLLLLDLNLPRRVGDPEPANAEVGLELLKQIVEDNAFKLVSNVIGVTSDPSSMKDYDHEFRTLTTQILLIDPISSDWKTSLRFTIERLFRAEKKSYDIDLCFLTALREPEQKEVLNLPIEWQAEESLGNGVLFKRGKFSLNGKEIKVVSAHATQMGLVASAFITHSLIQLFRPKLLLMTGICGGVGDKAKIGDVVIAERSWDWQSGKWLHNGDFDISPDSKDASAELVALGIGEEAKIESFHFSFRGNRPSTQPKLLVGPMVSGSAVVADPKMHNKFITQHRKCVAVDMECYGMYFSAQHMIHPTPKFLCIKSISDLANRTKSDNYQQYCSYLSANLGFEIAKTYLLKN